MWCTLKTWALVDSGADISCIDWDFMKGNKLSFTKLPIPIPVNNVDKTANKSSAIWYSCFLFLHIEGVTTEETPHKMYCRNENVILERP